MMIRKLEIELTRRLADEAAADLEAIAKILRDRTGIAALPSRLAHGPRAIRRLNIEMEGIQN